jgi:hypothetical protein
MEDNFFVFTEAFNCGKILSVCLESFHKHHNIKVHIIGTSKDFLEAGEIINHPNNVLINWDDNQHAKDGWNNGHQGTALAFASCMGGKINTTNLVVHFDADCYFKEESLSEIFFLLKNGYDVIGTPRPYKNNLSGVRGLDDTPDCVSTYLMGINVSKIPSNIPFETLVRMCGGWVSPSGYRILDFFDPVTHSIIKNGGKIYFLSTHKYGGIDLNGSKENGFKTNLNFDCGSSIVHFGGVGSGKAIADNLSRPPKGYADWALYRWNFYSHLFFHTDIISGETVYSKPDDHGGKRWCNGPADFSIIDNAKKDLKL